MTTLNLLAELYRHMEWADAEVWTAVLESESARVDAKLRRCLYHLHLVQAAFLRTWRGEPPETPYPTFDDARALMLWGRAYHGEVQAYWPAIDDARLVRPMPLAWSSMVAQRLGHEPHPTTLGETVLQVALHSVYHRGQVNARVREVGGEPPLVDYIAWIWAGRPGASWPASNGPDSPI